MADGGFVGEKRCLNPACYISRSAVRTGLRRCLVCGTELVLIMTEREFLDYLLNRDKENT